MASENDKMEKILCKGPCNKEFPRNSIRKHLARAKACHSSYTDEEHDAFKNSSREINKLKTRVAQKENYNEDAREARSQKHKETYNEAARATRSQTLKETYNAKAKEAMKRKHQETYDENVKKTRREEQKETFDENQKKTRSEKCKETILCKMKTINDLPDEILLHVFKYYTLCTSALSDDAH